VSRSLAGARYWSIGSPFWFLILLSAISVVVPWIRWTQRFSLRTFLIATTLIAVLLATAAYLRLCRMRVGFGTWFDVLSGQFDNTRKPRYESKHRKSDTDKYWSLRAHRGPWTLNGNCRGAIRQHEHDNRLSAGPVSETHRIGEPETLPEYERAVRLFAGKVVGSGRSGVFFSARMLNHPSALPVAPPHPLWMHTSG
jgi:hypothetical protein